jgi:CelD/BcsL family acetyltransferase involved in cellulose biosynthesis
MRVFEDLCENEKIEAVDFGLGDAQYKREYCDDTWQEYSVFLFAPTLRPLFLNALRGGTRALSLYAERLIGEGIRLRIKRAWRSYRT